jgi:hypothetical protein
MSIKDSINLGQFEETSTKVFNKAWVYLLIKKREEFKSLKWMFKMVEAGLLLLLE